MRNQRQKLEELYFYDDECNIWVDRAKANVVFIEAKLYLRKILMIVLIICLAVITVICLISKLTG